MTLARAMTYLAGRPVISVVIAALTLRLILVAGGNLIPGSWIALDDSTYSNLAQQMASGATEGWTQYLWTLYGATATFLVPLTLLYWLFGPIELLGQLTVAVIGAGAAALTTKLALERLEARWAIVAGLVVAFLPSQIAWSVVLLKDAWVWACTAALALAVAVAFRARGRNLVFSAFGAVVLLFLLGHLRLQSTFVAAWALFISALLVPRERRLTWASGALVVAISVPWLAGGGPGGIDPVLARAKDFEQTRVAAAAGADSAVVAAATTVPTTAVTVSTGTVDTSPGPSSTASPETPDGSADSESLTSRILTDLSHLPRGISVMLLEPYPWDANRNTRVIFAKLDTLLWYPILALALVGLGQVKRNRRVLVFPVVVGAGTLVGYALAEGNLGTAFRHRGELVWIVALLGVFGARSLLERRRARQTSTIA